MGLIHQMEIFRERRGKTMLFVRKQKREETNKSSFRVLFGFIFAFLAVHMGNEKKVPNLLYNGSMGLQDPKVDND